MADPIAFISYAHIDDESGGLKVFRDRLSIAVQQFIGGPFPIFWDRVNITWGSTWRDRIANSIDAATFLIPIVTPSFFRSPECRLELKQFLQHEQRLARKNLVLPLYYIDVPELNDKDKEPDDELMQATKAHQWADWRELRLARSKQPRFIADLASQIRDILRNTAAAPLPSAAPPMVVSANKRALLVGSSSYTQASQFPHFPSAKRNVEEMARVLQSTSGFDVKPVVDAASNDLKKEFLALVRATGSGDLVLLYFSGYAKISAEDGVCICTSDTDVELIDSTSMPLKWLKEKVTDKIPATQVIVILDCRYGRIDGNAEGDVARALQTDLGKGKGKCLITSSLEIIQLTTDSAGGGVAPAAVPSVFSKWLVSGLASWDADRNNDDIISLDELYAYASDNTKREAPQQPFKWDFELAEPGRYEIARRTHAQPSPAVVNALDAATSDALNSVGMLLDEGKIIPFLGDGIYGSGPLSSFAIIGALAERGKFKMDERPPLATAAEYFEQIKISGPTFEQRSRARKVLVARFREILEEQTAKLGGETKAAHDLVLDKVAAPWIVVSATYDQMLEQRLDAKGIPYVLVAHILRCSNVSKEGMILLVWRGANPGKKVWIGKADDFTLDELAPPDGPFRVIYKVMGSPFLHDAVNESLEIDTVVLTETDHITFLAHLENQHTSVPEAFSLPFQDRRFLFLGYNMDVWHYRLVARVFSMDRLAKTGGTAFAVRQPTSPMEARFWRRLDADLLRTDSETAARVLLGNN